MKKKILNKLLQHQSLGIIVFGAGSFFLTNIILKEKLSDREYGEYSMVMTFFSMLYIYGLLGLEQVFVKYSHVKEKNSIETNRFLLRMSIFSLFISSVISCSFFLIYYDKIPINPLLFIVTTVAMSSMLLMYSIFRLNSNFVLAQIAQNGFKILFFVCILIMLIIKRFNLNEILLGLAFCILLVFLAEIVILKDKFRFVLELKTTQKTIITAGFYFFISTATFSLINFADRYLIENKFGIEKVGDYFYLSNIFLAPFSILQSYIGFRKLVDYKNLYTVDKFKKNNKINLVLGIILSLLLLLVFQILVSINIVNFDFYAEKNIILLLLVLGTVKLYSAGIYPAFDLMISLENLKKAKLIVMFLSLMILIITFLWAKNIETIISFIILIWLLKTLILRSFLLLQEKNKHFE